MYSHRCFNKHIRYERNGRFLYEKSKTKKRACELNHFTLAGCVFGISFFQSLNAMELCNICTLLQTKIIINLLLFGEHIQGNNNGHTQCALNHHHQSDTLENFIDRKHAKRTRSFRIIDTRPCSGYHIVFGMDFVVVVCLMITK